MTKKEIKEFLSKYKITEEELDEIWNDCASFPEYGGGTISRLNSQGLTWRDINSMALSTIFDVYEGIKQKIFKSFEDNEKKSN